MQKKTNQLLENRVRKIYEQILNEGPNADQQLRLISLIQNLCDTFKKGNIHGLAFTKNLSNLLRDFKKTTGG